MKIFLRTSASLRLYGLIVLFAVPMVAQVPSPKSILGFHPTDDKTIADWSQISDYFAKLDRASNKVAVREIERFQQASGNARFDST